jgi:hypothetical protein
VNDRSNAWFGGKNNLVLFRYYDFVFLSVLAPGQARWAEAQRGTLGEDSIFVFSPPNVELRRGNASAFSRRFLERLVRCNIGQIDC